MRVGNDNDQAAANPNESAHAFLAELQDEPRDEDLFVAVHGVRMHVRRVASLLGRITRARQGTLMYNEVVALNVILRSGVPSKDVSEDQLRGMVDVTKKKIVSAYAMLCG